MSFFHDDLGHAITVALQQHQRTNLISPDEPATCSCGDTIAWGESYAEHQANGVLRALLDEGDPA
jgi:hypothetical protein